mmetsp:Transcript_1997/g.2687  ORF Transcript_1997/g.2687 Transcript_1997/m.2687 type:complete len:263 (+) Transcript_1997:1309-2097(+)
MTLVVNLVCLGRVALGAVHVHRTTRHPLHKTRRLCQQVSSSACCTPFVLALKIEGLSKQSIHLARFICATMMYNKFCRFRTRCSVRIQRSDLSLLKVINRVRFIPLGGETVKVNSDFFGLFSILVLVSLAGDSFNNFHDTSGEPVIPMINCIHTETQLEILLGAGPQTTRHGFRNGQQICIVQTALRLVAIASHEFLDQAHLLLHTTSALFLDVVGPIFFLLFRDGLLFGSNVVCALIHAGIVHGSWPNRVFKGNNLCRLCR